MTVQVTDSQGRDKALGQLADTVAAFVSGVESGERERRWLLRLTAVFSGIAAVGAVVAAVAAV